MKVVLRSLLILATVDPVHIREEGLGLRYFQGQQLYLDKPVSIGV